MRFFLLLICLCSASSAVAQLATIPEIEGPRAKYNQALAAIRNERDQQAAETNRTYAASLQDLLKELTAEGETQAAVAVQLEINRIAKGEEPTNLERRKMTGLLLATRVARGGGSPAPRGGSPGREAKRSGVPWAVPARLRRVGGEARASPVNGACQRMLPVRSSASAVGAIRQRRDCSA